MKTKKIIAKSIFVFIVHFFSIGLFFIFGLGTGLMNSTLANDKKAEYASAQEILSTFYNAWNPSIDPEFAGTYNKDNRSLLVINQLTKHFDKIQIISENVQTPFIRKFIFDSYDAHSYFFNHLSKKYNMIRQEYYLAKSDNAVPSFIHALKYSADLYHALATDAYVFLANDLRNAFLIATAISNNKLKTSDDAIVIYNEYLIFYKKITSLPSFKRLHESLDDLDYFQNPIIDHDLISYFYLLKTATLAQFSRNPKTRIGFLRDLFDLNFRALKNTLNNPNPASIKIGLSELNRINKKILDFSNNISMPERWHQLKKYACELNLISPKN